jgi:hypothetical protein
VEIPNVSPVLQLCFIYNTTARLYLEKPHCALLLTMISDSAEFAAYYRLLIYTVDVVRDPVKIRDRWNLTTVMKEKMLLWRMIT